MIKLLQTLQQSFPFSIWLDDDAIFTSSWVVSIDSVIKDLLIQKGFGFSKIKNVGCRNIYGLFGLTDKKQPVFKNFVVFQEFRIDNFVKVGDEPFI